MTTARVREAAANLQHNDNFKEIVAYIETQKAAATEQLLSAPPETVLVCQGRVQSLTSILKDIIV